MCWLTKPSIILFIFYYLFKEQNSVVTWEGFAEKTFRYNLPLPITVNNYYLTEIKTLTFYGQM